MEIPSKPKYKVYDPMTNKYNIDWMLIWIGNFPQWIPIWND
jgi:hypothetical protein